MTDIPQSSELSIEYLPGLITSSAAERRQQLRTHFGFDACLCPVCSAPPEDVARSDARRREIKAISQSFRYGGGGDRKAKLAGLQRIQDLLTEEGYKGLPDFGASRTCRARCSIVDEPCSPGGCLCRRLGFEQGIYHLSNNVKPERGR